MGLDEIATEALRLPPRERATLAESLWQSLPDPDEAACPDDRTDIATALLRDQQLENGEVQPLSHSELMRRLR